MIQLYTGVPGSGKSYKMVLDLNELLKTNEDLTLITNINSLKLPHIDFEDFVKECFPEAKGNITQHLEQFFQYDHQAQVNEKFGGPVMYVLDECQLYFPRRASMPNTEEYLQRHRHLGHYIYLATQSSKLINLRIIPLIEIEYSAVRRTISFFGEMRYRIKSPQSNELLSTKTIYPKKAIFDLYKSFQAEELMKPKRQLIKRLIPIAVILLVGIYFTYTRIIDKDARVAQLTGGPKTSQVNQNPEVEREPPKPPQLPRQPEPVKEVKPPQKERFFLDVIQVGDKRLTICPDTLEIIPIELVKRAVTCVGGGLRCYYDREPGTETKFAGQGQRTGGNLPLFNSPPMQLPFQSSQSQRTKSPQAGAGYFIEPWMVPEGSNR